MNIQISRLSINTKYITPSLEQFVCDTSATDIVVDFGKCQNLFDDKYFQVDQQDFSVYCMKEGWIYETFEKEQIYVSRAYNEMKIYFPNSKDKEAQKIRIQLLFRIAVECRLIKEGILSLHSACVEKDGKAIAFTGISGTGKSTRAKQWVETLGAEWISGDRPAVDVENKIIYGVPWDGKEQIFRNVSFPLGAVLDVKRGPFTRIRRLSTKQARNVLLNQCFIPMWDSEIASMAMALILRFAKEVPIYRLICDMDEIAANETHRILYDAENEIFPEEVDLKIKEGFILRNVVGEYMVMPTGNNVAKFDGAIALNEVAAFLFQKLQKTASKEELLEHLLAEYEVEKEAAAQDIEMVLDKFREYGILEEQE